MTSEEEMRTDIVALYNLWRQALERIAELERRCQLLETKQGRAEARSKPQP